MKAVRLNDDGEGVAPVDGFTVFVPGLLPGERADVNVTEVHARFARAQIVRRHTSAPDRVPPPCTAFGACGGCQLQHLAYDQQLVWKREVVRSALARIAKLPDADALVRPTLGMERPWRYRNHVQVPVQYEAGRMVAGFFAPGGRQVVPTEVCHLMPEAMEATLRQVLERLPEALGDQARLAHHLILRRSHTTGEQMVVLALHSAAFDRDAAIAAIRTLPHVVSIAGTVQPQAQGPVWGPTAEVWWGRRYLTERLGGLEFLISPRSFFQVNTAQADRLYQVALSYADANPRTDALDAYCGTGTIALLLARRARRVTGLESAAAAVRDAVENASHNGLDNAEFLLGRVEERLPELVASGRRFDVVVLDPPRAGCDPAVLRAVAAAAPQRVVYVSCNPATFARDARRLADAGYRLAVVQPVDMFPQTSHVECCSLFIRSTVAKKQSPAIQNKHLIQRE